MLTSPQGKVTTYSYRLEFDYTNNVAKYEALLVSLEIAREMKVKCLSVNGDSDLTVCQVKDEFSTKNDRLKRYMHVV